MNRLLHIPTHYRSFLNCKASWNSLYITGKRVVLCGLPVLGTYTCSVFWITENVFVVVGVIHLYSLQFSDVKLIDSGNIIRVTNRYRIYVVTFSCTCFYYLTSWTWENCPCAYLIPIASTNESAVVNILTKFQGYHIPLVLIRGQSRYKNIYIIVTTCCVRQFQDLELPILKK